MENALFRLSKYSGDKNVFNDYTIHVLQKTALQMDGYLNYACALGGQNGIPTLVSYADHTIHAIARRTGIQFVPCAAPALHTASFLTSCRCLRITGKQSGPRQRYRECTFPTRFFVGS